MASNRTTEKQPNSWLKCLLDQGMTDSVESNAWPQPPTAAVAVAAVVASRFVVVAVAAGHDDGVAGQGMVASCQRLTAD